MTTDEQAAAEALDGFVPIGNDHPRTQEFADDVAAYLAERAARPSPVVLPPDPLETRLEQIAARLDEIRAVVHEIRAAVRGGA